MPEIFIPSTDGAFTLLLTPSEMDTVREISIIKKASIRTIIEASVTLGLNQIEQTRNTPKLPTLQRKRHD